MLDELKQRYASKYRASVPKEEKDLSDYLRRACPIPTLDRALSNFKIGSKSRACLREGLEDRPGITILLL